MKLFTRLELGHSSLSIGFIATGGNKDKSSKHKYLTFFIICKKLSEK